MKIKAFVTFVLSVFVSSIAFASFADKNTDEELSPGLNSSSIIEIKGTNFTLNQQPFNFTGITFFNALYNPTFNSSEANQLHWLKKLNDNGITVIRIWAEWNNDLGFIDTCDSCIVYNRDGSLRPFYLNRLKSLLNASASLDMVVEYVFFSSESKNKKLSDEAANKAVENITQELMPYRNLVFQIWNENDYRVEDYYKIIKQIDPDRLVSNSPGGGGTLGNDDHNELLDFLTPHTSRHGKHWEKVEEEIKGLITKFNKPVVDDEPARCGTRETEWLGGPKDETSPFDHIIHIYNVWKAGGHASYHHDMFQTDYGTKPIPPSGIPDPDFDQYHKIVFEFLRLEERFK
ncbi:MAG: hypothetical protein ACQEQ0_03795 [Bacteroidota bacterium]